MIAKAHVAIDHNFPHKKRLIIVQKNSFVKWDGERDNEQ